MVFISAPRTLSYQMQDANEHLKMGLKIPVTDGAEPVPLKIRSLDCQFKEKTSSAGDLQLYFRQAEDV